MKSKAVTEKVMQGVLHRRLYFGAGGSFLFASFFLQMESLRSEKLDL